MAVGAWYNMCERMGGCLSLSFGRYSCRGLRRIEGCGITVGVSDALRPVDDQTRLEFCRSSDKKGALPLARPTWYARIIEGSS